MKSLPASSLRLRLAMVVLIAIIPALGLIYYNAHELRSAGVEQAREDVARVARLTAAHYRGIIEGTRQVLITLASVQEVRSSNASTCGPALQKLLAEYSFFSNLGVAGADGNVLCSAVPLTEPLSVADSVWFRQAMKTHDFTVGEYQKSAVNAQPSLNFGYPVGGVDGQAPRIVFASLDFAYLVRQISFVLPTEGAEIAVVDRNGVILGETGGREDRVGRLSPDAAQIKQVSAHRGREVNQWFDPAGIERIYAFYPIGGNRAGVDIYVAASMPTAIAFAEANLHLQRNLIALAVTVLLALLGAWYGGEAIVLRRANDELEQHVQERTRELAHEQFLLRTLLDNVPDSIYFKDAKGRFLRSSRAQAQRFGLSDPAQAVGKTDSDFFAKEHAEEALADEQRIMQTGQPMINAEEHSPLADGTDRWVSTSKLPLRDKEGNIIGTFGISREITERKRAETALAKERNLLRTLINNLPDLVFIKDRRGRYVLDNAAHRAFMSVSSMDEIVGKTVYDLYARDVADRVHADDEVVLASESPLLRREEDLTDRKGRKMHALTSKIPYRDEQDRIVGLVCISRPLGETK